MAACRRPGGAEVRWSEVRLHANGCAGEGVAKEFHGGQTQEGSAAAAGMSARRAHAGGIRVCIRRDGSSHSRSARDKRAMYADFSMRHFTNG